MRLIILPISIFGAIGTPGQAFISELSRRVGGSVPPSLLPHASWATPRVGPMIRMALTHAVRRGLAASIHTHWRRESLVAEDEAMPPAPPAGGPPPGFIHAHAPQLASLASLATPAFMAALMAWQAECMRDDGSFGAWLRPWRIVPQCLFTFTFTVYPVLWFEMTPTALFWSGRQIGAISQCSRPTRTGEGACWRG